MKMTRKEILDLVLKSLDENPDMWLGDDSVMSSPPGNIYLHVTLVNSYDFGEMPRWMYNEDIGLCINTRDGVSGISILLLDKYSGGGGFKKGSVVLVPNWWNRIKIHRKCKSIRNNKKIEVKISDRFLREEKLGKIFKK